MTVISAIWVVLGFLVALAVYRQLRSYQQLGRSFHAFATSHERLVEHLDAAIRSFEEMLSQGPIEKASEGPLSRGSETPSPSRSADQVATVGFVDKSVPAVRKDYQKELPGDDVPNKKITEDLQEKIRKLLSSSLFKLGNLPDGWKPASEEEIDSFIEIFQLKIRYKPAAGDVTMVFAQAILSVIGSDRWLNQRQKTLVEKICSAVNELRPFPTMLWVDFVRARLDKPEIVSRILALFWESTLRLKEQIRNVMGQHFQELGLQDGGLILVWGYSATIDAALRGLPSDVASTLEIVSPLQTLEDRKKPDGELLRDALHDFIHVEIVKNEVALNRIRQGAPKLALMGCGVTGLRRTGSLEVVNSKGARDCAEAAAKAKIPVGVIAGAYKSWPAKTYEKYRPLIVLDDTRNTVPGELIEWFMREDGLFSQDAFRACYNDLFITGGIPLATIRVSLGEMWPSPEELALRIKEIAKELEVEERPLEDLPDHFLEAEKYYEEKVKDEEWLREYLGKHVAIIGNKVVDSDRAFHELSLRIREKYGYGPIYMPEVRRSPRVEHLGPRITA